MAFSIIFSVKNVSRFLLHFLISLIKDFDTRNTDIDIFEDKKQRFQSLFVELMGLMTNQMSIMDIKGFLPGFILMKDNVMDAINKIDYLAEKNFLVLFNSPDNSCTHTPGRCP